MKTQKEKPTGYVTIGSTRYVALPLITESIDTMAPECLPCLAAHMGINQKRITSRSFYTAEDAARLIDAADGLVSRAHLVQWLGIRKCHVIFKKFTPVLKTRRVCLYDLADVDAMILMIKQNRIKYPPPKKVDEDMIGPPQPPRATSAEPGSEEKIAIMQQRVADGFSATHPDDKKHVGTSSTLGRLRCFTLGSDGYSTASLLEL